MEPNERARKQVETRSGQSKAKPKRLAVGQLKGRPLADVDRPERIKPSIAAARRAVVSQDDGRRRPQLERPAPPRAVEQQSLRLRLRVAGESITVLDADIVDAPGTLPEEIRGTHFLEVRLGDRILAAQALRDPGRAVGIPDRSDRKAMRGHRFLELDQYELAVRVPLRALESVIAGSLPSRGASGAGSRLEIAIFKAAASLSLDPRAAGSLMARHRGQLERLARSEPLRVDSLYGAGGRLRKQGDEAR